jgi:RND family efflux transporter MFP subunit
MKRMMKTTILATILAIAALPACKPASKKEAGPAAAVAGAPVRAAKVTRQRVTEKISYTTTLEAWRKITITPEVGGKIARINVQEGDRVAAGQLLAEMDTESIRLQLRQAEAGQAVAQAAEADARRNKERLDRLFAENAVSAQQREQVQLAYESAAAQLEQARASVNLARYTLDQSLMKAPFAGIIASKNAEVGDVINPMMGSSYGAAAGVLTLVDYGRIKLVVEVAQGDIGRIRKGQPAHLTVGYAPGRDFLGEVTVVNLAADAATRRFGLEVRVDNPDLTLRPGTFGNLILEVESHENALAVPQKAVLDNSYVYVVEGGKAVRKAVTLGLENTTSVEVLSGLAEGDLVIIEGNYGLEDGAAVEVKAEVRP